MFARTLLSLLLFAAPVFAESPGAIPAASSATIEPMVKAAIPAPQIPKLQPEPIHIILDGARKSGDCMLEGNAVRQEVQTLPFPPGWRIAIMCTPVRWEQLVQQVNPPRTDAAFTRISERITVLNGAIFHAFPLRYRHIMAHELAHIQCNCVDESYADSLADKLEKKAAR